MLYKDLESIAYQLDKQLEWYKNWDTVEISLWCPEKDFPNEVLLNKVRDIYLKKGWDCVTWKYRPVQWWETLIQSRSADFVFTFKRKRKKSQLIWTRIVA